MKHSDGHKVYMIGKKKRPFISPIPNKCRFPTSHLEEGHIAGYIAHQHNYLITLNSNSAIKIVIYFCYLFFSSALTLFGTYNQNKC